MIKQPFDWSKVPVIFLSKILGLDKYLHFRQFSFDSWLFKWQFFSNVFDINSCVRFDDFEKIFFQQVIIKQLGMVIDDLITFDFRWESFENIWKGDNGWWKMGISNLFDGLDVTIDWVFQTELSV